MCKRTHLTPRKWGSMHKRAQGARIVVSATIVHKGGAFILIGIVDGACTVCVHRAIPR